MPSEYRMSGIIIGSPQVVGMLVEDSECTLLFLKSQTVLSLHSHVMRGSRGGGGPDTPPPGFEKLNIADITGNEKISYFSYLCTSTVIRQTESILLKVAPPGKIFWIRACMSHIYVHKPYKYHRAITQTITYISNMYKPFMYFYPGRISI